MQITHHDIATLIRNYKFTPDYISVSEGFRDDSFVRITATAIHDITTEKDDYEWIDGKRVKKKKESTEEEDEGWGINWGDPEDTAKDIYDLEHPEKAEEEDVELVPDKGEFLNMMRDMQAPPEKAEEDDYIDDSDNAGEKYVCPDCDEEFNSDEQLKEHQYANYHGKYKDEGEGEDMPRNVMGGY